jgi:peptidyl-prolyl cis-trans isomerase B (cyclophilin B)
MSNARKPRVPTQPPARNRNTGTIIIIAVIVAVVIVGFVAIGALVGNDSGSKNQAGSTPPKNTPTSPLPPTSTGSGSTGTLHCTAPPPLPKSPQQFKSPPSPSLAQDSTWEVTMQTNCGPIVMDLDGKDAPQTVASFLFLAQKKYFDDVPCHRLTTPDQGLEVLQCGDPTGTGSGGPGYGYGIENAPPTGDYPEGTVAMARTSDPNSNGSQFFIVYQDTQLPTDGGGYSIFGKVVQGLDIVKQVAAEGLAQDGTAPKQPVSILSVTAKKL